MSNQLFVIEHLCKKRLELIAERNAINNRFEGEISEIETAIETLSGKKVWEVVKEERFDDENPDYIKSSIED